MARLRDRVFNGQFEGRTKCDDVVRYGVSRMPAEKAGS